MAAVSRDYIISATARKGADGGHIMTTALGEEEKFHPTPFYAQSGVSGTCAAEADTINF